MRIETPAAALWRWRELLQAAPHDGWAQTELDEIIRSAVIDLIDNKMAQDAEYAMVIGQRIEALDDAVAVRIVE